MLKQMSQFFMKMAEAVQQGTLKPGGTIPGCNSYFLCKYLKDTMLQARQGRELTMAFIPSTYRSAERDSGKLSITAVFVCFTCTKPRRL